MIVGVIEMPLATNQYATRSSAYWLVTRVFPCVGRLCILRPLIGIEQSGLQDFSKKWFLGWSSGGANSILLLPFSESSNYQLKVSAVEYGSSDSDFDRLHCRLLKLKCH